MGPLVLDSLTVMPAGHKTDLFSSEGAQSSTALIFVRACEQLCLLLEDYLSPDHLGGSLELLASKSQLPSMWKPWEGSGLCSRRIQCACEFAWHLSSGAAPPARIRGLPNPLSYISWSHLLTVLLIAVA